ncbi:unnamed protein product [Paramecium pentaurelia]|uniref:Calmodulin n=1 Tax=Paramecium pentaurelia TaxID=43138 RepID=A0A8S1SPA0_9CILI|nr:unnamed protein product [Paramecium pentaurelia]
MDQQLTEDQIANYKEAFSLFDKDGDNKIKVDDLGLLIRSLNQNPTETEISEMKNDVDPDSTGMVDFPEFLSLMARKHRDVDPEEELMDAFRILDKSNKGTINANELRHMVKSMGERLTEEEANQLIKEANPDKDLEIRYEDFVKLITTKYIL